MPTHCCVPLCKQRGYKDGNGSKVSFHRFPDDGDQRKKWLIAIKRDQGRFFKLGKATKVCSKHFLPSDFVSNVASGHHHLHQNAVSSVFAFTPAQKSRKPPFPRALDTVCDHPTSSNDVTVENEDWGEGIAPTSEEEVTVPQCHETCNNAACVIYISNLQKQISEQHLEIVRLRQELLWHKDKLDKEKQEKCNAELKFALLAKEHGNCPSKFDIDSVSDCSESIQFYTGLPSLNRFEILHNFLDPGENGCNVRRNQKPGDTSDLFCGRQRKLSTRSELFLVLVRLRLGLFEQDLAFRFGISQATVSRICVSWIDFLYLKLTVLPIWQPRSVINETMPPAFKDKYPTTRVILDATEIRCKVPSSLGLQSSTYSTYKSTNTFKGLIGIAPNGLVSFVSELFTGCTSDRECVLRSGFLHLPFDEEDSVMADKGFTIADLLAEKNVHLNIPPFLRGGEFTSDEVQQTKQIASLRIHVERRIQRVKTFHIFDRPIPLSLGPVINQMWTVATLLTNFQSPLLKTDNM